MPVDDRWMLADPELAVGLLGTQRSRGDALADEPPGDPEAIAWVREHLGGFNADQRVQLMPLRGLLRELMTTVVDGIGPPAGAIAAINDLAAHAPVNLTAHQADDAAITVERISPGTPITVFRADIARSALTLLTHPARERLRLCRAPGCTLFFLTDRRRQQWCSADCGNRARVARHYNRHNRRQSQ